MGNTTSAVMDNIVQGTNCRHTTLLRFRLSVAGGDAARSACGSRQRWLLTLLYHHAVDRDEVDRLRKRFMKLDKAGPPPPLRPSARTLDRGGGFVERG